MSEEPSLRKLLAPMSERQVDLEGVEFHVGRERVLARMAQANRCDRRAWMGYVAVFAAAAALVLVFGARRWRDSGSTHSTSLDVTVSEGSATQVRGELETASNSNALVRTSDGLQIELRSQTRVALDELQSRASRVKLLGGTVRCTVPHRSAAQAFQIETPDATVVDLGTVFMVTLDGRNGTRVSVEEGEVLIRQPSGETRVRAPHTWSSSPMADDPSATAGAAEIASRPASVAADASEREMQPGAKTSKDKEMPAPTLTHEARLLRQGLAAERQGHAADAISALTQLLTKYPQSPLAPDARTALTRIEASTQR